jgi:sugar transferase (PEP-CTERM system associated)
MKERVLIMGSGIIARELALEIMNDPGCGMQVVGFLSAEPSEVGKSVINPKVLGSMDDMYQVVKENRIDRVVVAMDERSGSLPVREILRCKFEGVDVQEGTALMEQLSGKIFIQNLRPSWIIFSEGFRKGELTKRIKRIIDLSASTVLIFVTWPFMLLTAAAVKLESPGPVLYRQRRIGQWNREFYLLKFRSMVVDAELNGAQWAVKNDVRVTRVGRVIRKLRLDELPQLYNVMKGQMSLVGPRPERPEFVVQLREKIPYYDERHSVKPGVTGWAQVQFSYGNTIEDSQEKLEYDLFYIKNLSPLLDLVIIFQTVKVVLLGRGAL